MKKKEEKGNDAAVLPYDTVITLLKFFTLRYVVVCMKSFLHTAVTSAHF